MIENKDLKLIALILESKEEKSADEVKLLSKINLIVNFNDVKEEYDGKLYDIQDKLRALYESDKKGE